ncbi:MAG: peptidoglycan-associated lipoprotein [Burkholderiales bacterium PBB5]|nr:MAG: peptidoglycan-associated lipoprotein [Burkholderiales bacterium PBB5]
MMMGLRATTLASLAALVLAGCASSVKLDETPVESRTPTPVTNRAASGGNPATASGSTAPTAPQSQVATVDLAAGGRGTGTATAGTAAAAATALGRVVYFDFDSYVVKDDYRALVEGHAKQLAAAKGKRLIVEGHTDERGGREYNLALGQKRAEAVVKSLALLGASDGQLEAVSFGKERPVAEGHDEEAWAKNRRAELKDR